MPSTVQVQALLDEAAFRLHTPAFGTGEFISLADALRIMKGSCTRLSALLASAFGSELFARTDRLTVQAGLDLASLPQDFESLRTVHLDLNGTLYELRAAHPAGEAGYGGTSEVNTAAAAWTAHCVPGYWLEDQVIRFSSPPTEALEVVVSYVSTGLSFADQTSYLVLGAGWDEWLVNDFCEKARVREQKDPSDFVRMRAETTQLIMNAAVKRDRFAPLQIRDVRPRRVSTSYWPGRYR